MKNKYNYSDKVNLPPGSLVYTGERITEEPEVSLVAYSKSDFIRRKLEIEQKAIEIPIIRNKNTNIWLNVKGISSVELIENIGRAFELHPLLLEDILSPNQRSKYEEFDNCVFIILRRVDWDENQDDLSTEQISLVLLPSKVIIFQEKLDNYFLPIEKRIENSKGKIREYDASYLLYALMDSIVDRYFIALEKIGDKIESIESSIHQEPKPEYVSDIHKLNHTVRLFKKAIWPLRDALNLLIRSENSIILPSNSLYYRDLIDHVNRVLDTIESYKELLSNMLDLYISMIGNKSNDIMKVLTIIATIFIPLTFIAGVYGMNFDFMPELTSPWGYPIVWIIMILISVGLLIYFRKKKWI